MVEVATLIVLVLATMRAVRILRWDYITGWLRRWATLHLPANGIPYLLHCHWCLSFWLALGPAAAHIYWPTNRFLHFAILALAISEAAILIHDRTETAGSQ